MSRTHVEDDSLLKADEEMNPLMELGESTLKRLYEERDFESLTREETVSMP